MGAISPLGVGMNPVWARLLDWQSGIRQLPADIVQDLPVKVGGLVPALDMDSAAGFDPAAVLDVK